MVQKIEIKKRWTGEVLFSHECEDNTICKTVLAALKRYANLRYADLRSADLRYADLNSADLNSADLRSANLHSADLRSALYNEHTAFLALQCPEEGEFIGWKRVKSCIVKLLIPADAQRSSATTRKCRASKAHVLAIYDKDGNEKESVMSDNYVPTTYKVGEDVIPDSWDDDRWNECSHGIHFFITRREAELYN